MAFKLLPGVEAGSEVELVQNICKEIEAAHAAQLKKERAPKVDGQVAVNEGEREEFVVNKDVIGLAEAKKSTGFLEQWGYSLRKSVWA